MASMEKLVEKAFEKLIERFSDTCFDYLKEQFRWQTGMKEDLQNLRENLPKIQAIFSRTIQIVDQNSDLDKWIQQIKVAIDAANEFLNAFNFNPNQPEEQPAVNEETMSMVRFIFNNYITRPVKKARLICERAVKIDPVLKKLEDVVRKFDAILADATPFLQLIESRKKEQREMQVELREARETGCLVRNDLKIGLEEFKKKVIKWLMDLPNEKTTTTLYRNIFVLSIVGDSNSGKTTLLQHVYADEMTEEFKLKMWVCVSDNFDFKKVIADMLESLEKKRPSSSSSLAVLQNSLKFEVESKKFLLVLDGLDEELDVSKLENVLSCLREGGFGSKILVTTRKDSVASMIAKVIRKEKKTILITPISS